MLPVSRIRPELVIVPEVMYPLVHSKTPLAEISAEVLKASVPPATSVWVPDAAPRRSTSVVMPPTVTV
ncbi:MAG: hypothetical protein CMM84_19985 [Rhodothermaceae bacterium]|nr:hypothetical protein [Rhodothermaceae bacterium]